MANTYKLTPDTMATKSKEMFGSTYFCGRFLKDNTPLHAAEARANENKDGFIVAYDGIHAPLLKLLPMYSSYPTADDFVMHIARESKDSYHFFELYFDTMPLKMFFNLSWIVSAMRTPLLLRNFHYVVVKVLNLLMPAQQIGLPVIASSSYVRDDGLIKEEFRFVYRDVVLENIRVLKLVHQALRDAMRYEMVLVNGKYIVGEADPGAVCMLYSASESSTLVPIGNEFLAFAGDDNNCVRAFSRQSLTPCPWESSNVDDMVWQEFLDSCITNVTAERAQHMLTFTAASYALPATARNLQERQHMQHIQAALRALLQENLQDFNSEVGYPTHYGYEIPGRDGQEECYYYVTCHVLGERKCPWGNIHTMTDFVLTVLPYGMVYYEEFPGNCSCSGRRTLIGRISLNPDASADSDDMDAVQ